MSFKAIAIYCNRSSQANQPTPFNIYSHFLFRIVVADGLERIWRHNICNHHDGIKAILMTNVDTQFVTVMEDNYIIFNDILQPSAVITGFNIVRYGMNDSKSSHRITIRCWIYNIHQIPRHNGRAMGRLMNMYDTTDRVITAARHRWSISPPQVLIAHIVNTKMCVARRSTL